MTALECRTRLQQLEETSGSGGPIQVQLVLAGQRYAFTLEKRIRPGAVPFIALIPGGQPVEESHG